MPIYYFSHNCFCRRWDLWVWIASKWGRDMHLSFPHPAWIFKLLNYITEVELKGTHSFTGVRLDLVDMLWEPLEEYFSETSRYSQFLILTENEHWTSQLRRYWPCPEADVSVWEINTKLQMFLKWNGFENLGLKCQLDQHRQQLSIFYGFSSICNIQSRFTEMG